MTLVKTIAALGGAVAAAGGAAQAADLPARAAPPPYVAPLPVFTWTGAYFGVNGGASFDDTARYHLVGVLPGDNGVGTSRPVLFHGSDQGFTAGGQIGYNYQFGGAGLGATGLGFGGIVFGVEADAAYIDAARTQTYTGTSSAGFPAVNDFRSGIDFLGTVRGRLGVAFDRVLVYGTGGFAYADAFDKAALYTAGNPAQLRYGGSKDGLRVGHTFGGGVEYALPTGSFLNVFHSSAVTVRAEYLRYSLDATAFQATNLVVTGTGSAYTVHVKDEGNLARVGLNYKF